MKRSGPPGKLARPPGKLRVAPVRGPGGPPQRLHRGRRMVGSLDLVLPRPGTVPEANQPVIPIIKYYVQYRITIMIVGEQARFSDSF